MKNFNEIIESLKPEYLSDISWEYSYDFQNVSIKFWQDESGINYIENFCRKRNNIWFEVIPTDEQIKTMFNKLNNTPYNKISVCNETWENGHCEADFY